MIIKKNKGDGNKMIMKIKNKETGRMSEAVSIEDVILRQDEIEFELWETI